MLGNCSKRLLGCSVRFTYIYHFFFKAKGKVAKVKANNHIPYL